MASNPETTDSSFPQPVVPDPETPKKRKETPPPAPPPDPPEKQYRLYNTSGQTLYVVNSEGTHCLPPREHYDLPFSQISFHIKIMARRGFIRLFEKEENA